jgi:hypothetical protein
MTGLSREVVLGQRHLLVCFLASLTALFAFTGIASGAPLPTNLSPPSISGTPVAGQTLTAMPGSWTAEPTQFTYRWERCDKAYGTCIFFREESPENQNYVVTPEDVGNTLRVQVRAVNEAGKSDPAVSAAIEVERAWKFVAGPPRIETAGWGVGSVSKSKSAVKGKTLTISVSTGFCVGEPEPVIDHVSVVERPKTAARPFKSAVITAFVRFPAPTEVVGKVNKGEPEPACADLGYALSHRIKLKRPRGRLFIFDGSHSPPRRILSPVES